MKCSFSPWISITILFFFYKNVSGTSHDYSTKAVEEESPVIIIGGGAAGLAAAKSLKENGVPIILLEGRDRLGGRIHTVEVSQDQPSTVDLGAAYIDGVPDNYVYEVAVDAGLETVNQPYFDQRGIRFFNAKDSIGWMTFFKLIIPFLQLGLIVIRLELGNHPEGTSLGEALDWVDTSCIARKLLEAFYEPGSAARMTEIPLDIWDDVQYTSGTEVMIYGGYVGLINYLSKSINNDEIFLNTTVTNISVALEESDDHVLITTRDNETFVGSHVIVTVPLGVLKSDMISFNPPLPEKKLDAIRRIGFGTVERIVLTFKNAFWRKNSNVSSNIVYFADYHPSRFPIFIDCTDTAGSPTIFALLVQEIAQELHENPGALIEEVKNILQDMFPDTHEAPVDSTNSSWLHDPYSRGSYTNIGMEYQVGDIDILAEPSHDGRVLFAGESTDSQKTSYVEGAMLSGLREADRVIALRT